MSINPNVSVFDNENLKRIAETEFMKKNIKDLFLVLLNKDRTMGGTKTYDEIYDDLNVLIDAGSGKGFLSDISTRTAVNFSVIANETISFNEILDIFPFIFSADSGFDVEFKKAVISIIKNKFACKLHGSTKNEYESAVKGVDTFETLFETLRVFEGEIRDNDQKKEYHKLFVEGKLSIREITNELSSKGVDVSDIIGTDFSSWTEDHQKVYDTAISKAVALRLGGRISIAKNLVTEFADVFDQVCPPLRTLFKKYPMLKNDDIKNDPEFSSEMEELENLYAEAQDDSEISDIVKRIDNIKWKAYIKKMKLDDPRMGEALEELFNNNFDFSKLTIHRDYFFSKLGDIRLEQLKSPVNMLPLFGTNDAEFEKFFKDLFDLSKTSIHISGSGVSGLDLPVVKHVVSKENNAFYSLNDFQNNDELPLEFSIDVRNANLSAEDRVLFDKLFNISGEKGLSMDGDVVKVSGRNIGRLIYLYKMGQNSVFDSYNPKIVKEKLDNTFSELDKKETDDSIDRIEKNTIDEKNSEEEERDELGDFYREWDSISGMKGAAPNYGFQKGALLYFSLGDSELPPYERTGKEWNKMVITEVDETNRVFKAKIFGVERAIDGYENEQEVSHSMDGEWLKDSFGGANSRKLLEEKDDFNEQLDLLKKEKFCDESTFGTVKFKNGKFVFNPQLFDGGVGDEEEAAYFGATDMLPDLDPKGDASKITKYNVLYKVVHNPDHTFTIISDFVHTSGKATHHERKMSYSDFIIFMNEKKLSPKTKNQVIEDKKADSDIISSRSRKLKFISIGQLAYGIKNLWKSITTKYDERLKEQKEDFLDYLVSDVKIYNILGNALGFIPGMKEIANDLHGEAMLKKESNAWKAIEKWITKFNSLQDFSSLFEKGYDDPSGFNLNGVIGKGNTLKKILLSGDPVYNNSGLRAIMAAAMITNLKKGKGLYRSVQGQANNGLRIKCLLGKEHYERFRSLRAGLIEQINSGVANYDQVQDQLVKAEVDYIVNNIKNANGVDGAFGSVKDGGKQILKQLYSEKFASELESAANETMGLSSVKSQYEKISHNNFFIAANDFKKNVKSGRIQGALANLKKMGMLAKTSDQKKQVQVGLTFIIISGIMNRGCDKATRKRFDSLLVEYPLPSAFGAKKWSSQKNAVHLLNKIFPESDPRHFSTAVGYRIEDFDETSKNIPYADLLDNFSRWWFVNNDAIIDYMDGIKWGDYTGDNYDPILSDIQKELWKNNQSNPDNDWLKNPSITSEFPLNVSKTVMDYNIRYDKDGFIGEDADEKDGKREFFKKCRGELKKSMNRSSCKPEFILKQFVQLHCPNEGDASRLVSWLRTARSVKSINSFSLNIPKKEKDGSASVITQSFNYSDSDYKSILECAFLGDVFSRNSATPPDEVMGYLKEYYNYFVDHIDDGEDFEKILSEVFPKNVLNDKSSKKKVLIPWGFYNRYVGKSDQYSWIDYDDNLDNSDEKAIKKYLKNNEEVLNSDLSRLESRIKNAYTMQNLGGIVDKNGSLYEQVYGTAA